MSEDPDATELPHGDDAVLGNDDSGRLHRRPGGDMSWLTEHLGPNPVADKLIGQIGALMVGST
jgi:hypothetical protein